MEGRASLSLLCLLTITASCREAEPEPPRLARHAVAAPVKIHELSADVANIGSKPTGYAALGSTEVFFTSDGTLYATDGTAAGTNLVRDLGAALAPTDTPPHLVTLGAFAYWVEASGLWKTDGTVAGTSQVFAFDTSGQLSAPHDPAVFNGALYFSTGASLSVSDGTTAGTHVLVPSLLTLPRWQPAGSKLYFVCAVTPDTGFEPCVTDGTAAGTHVIKDVFPGERDSDTRFLGALGARALFSATKDPTHAARGLWITDGTAAGTVELLGPAAGATQSTIAADALPAAILGGIAYVPCFTPAAGNELCKTDGTTASVLDVITGTGSLAPSSPVVLGGRVAFAGTDTTGTELWSTDGTVAGTAQIVDLAPGSGSGFAGGRLVAVGATAYFAGHSVVTTANDLWKTDGTAAGTVRVAATQRVGLVQKTPLALAETSVLGGQLIFSADDSVTGAEPWITDGTAAGTHLIKDLIATRTQAVVHGFAAHHGATYLGTASTRAVTSQLWQSDGTTDGTISVVQSVVPGQITPAGFSLFFFDETAGVLWKTDGTAAGSLALGATPFFARPAALGNRLAFSAEVGGATENLWFSDGTPDGTKLADPPIYEPNNLTAIGGRLWVDGSPTTAFKPAPFVSDPFGAFTQLCDDCSAERGFAGTATSVVFSGSDLPHGVELWKSDATAAGTGLLADLEPGSGLSAPGSFFTWGQKGLALFEATKAGVRGVWRTDGVTTTALAPVVVAAPPQWLAWGDHVFFVGTDANGTELWRTDGTPAGTVIVADLDPGPGSSNPGMLTLVGAAGPLVFAAETPATGRELWQLTDPVGAPQLLADLAPGARSSRPTSLTVQGTAVLAAADAGDGYALWKIDGVGSDGDPPVLTCPDDVAVISDRPVPVNYPAPTATDAAGDTPTLTIDLASGGMFPVGDTRVHVVATDDANNAAACTFVVHVGPDGMPDAGSGGGGDDDGSSGNGNHGDGGGCSTTGTPGLLGALVALGVLAGLRRRRR